MPYIRKRGKTWSYTVDLEKDPVTGERNQDSKGGFRTKREAELAAAKVESAVADGVYVKESNTTFEEFANTWLKLYRASNAKESSIRQRGYQIKSLLKYFAKVRLRNISRKKYQDVLINMSETMAHSTVQGIHGVAQLLFKKAMEFSEIKINPTEYAKVPSAADEEELPKYMEKEQLAEFLRLAKHRGLHDDYLMFLVLAYTGLRIGELCALTWSDINIINCTISVNGTLVNLKDKAEEYRIGTPKTKSSRRIIDVDVNIIAELERHKAKQNEFKMSKRDVYHDKNFVFGRDDNSFGYPPTRRKIEHRMKRLTQWMDLPQKFSPHSLRHTHTSLCAEAGVSLEAIMQRLGHKSDATTRLVYLHVTKAVKKEASEKFSALLSKVVKL
ncbi:site-specific integrase [Paenibacillus alkaliterrae]|uniref:site-specific integrase n=1 Tax=Paenibacillus alkaliterrae TaxID=320909 RepID=UPI001F281834|nr:site-specific integrase [Paenibacillus alkaliterrae]MCF2939004.1 site-specific integrase [Paenibacillus alkaliterrae]